VIALERKFLATAADFNPVTYVLAGLRALIGEGWTGDVVVAVVAIAAVSALSFTLALLALRGRISRG
jgi:ABC-2 type transport system permease protein